MGPPPSGATEFEGIDDGRMVPVIPVKMTEAWLLIDAQAIARAAGRPSAQVQLPPVSRLEQLPDPKSLLEDLLFEAAGRPTGRRRMQFMSRVTSHRVNVAGYVEDFSRLDDLAAYQEFMQGLAAAYPYGQAFRD